MSPRGSHTGLAGAGRLCWFVRCCRQDLNSSCPRKQLQCGVPRTCRKGCPRYQRRVCTTAFWERAYWREFSRHGRLMGGEQMCSTCARNVRRQRWANAGGGAFNRRIRRCRAGMAGGLPTCLMKPGLGCVWLVCPPPPPAQSPFDRQALPYEGDSWLA